MFDERAAMRRYHSLLGVVTVLAFVATGAHMHFGLGHLREHPLDERIFIRSRHIYILAAGLVHLALGTYLVRAAGRVRMWGQLVGSVLLTVAAGLLLLAYFVERPTPELATPTSQMGLILLLAGSLAHFLAAPRPGA